MGLEEDISDSESKSFIKKAFKKVKNFISHPWIQFSVGVSAVFAYGSLPYLYLETVNNHFLNKYNINILNTTNLMIYSPMILFPTVYAFSFRPYFKTKNLYRKKGIDSEFSDKVKLTNRKQPMALGQMVRYVSYAAAFHHLSNFLIVLKILSFNKNYEFLQKIGGIKLFELSGYFHISYSATLIASAGFFIGKAIEGMNSQMLDPKIWSRFLGFFSEKKFVKEYAKLNKNIQNKNFYTYIDLGITAFEKRSIDEGLYFLEKAIDYEIPQVISKKPHILFEDISRNKIYKHKTLKNMLTHAIYVPCFKGGSNYALEIWQEIFKKEDSIPLRIFYAKHLEVIAPEKAESAWTNTLDMLIEKGNFISYGKSRHEVLTISEDKHGAYASGRIIIKKSENIKKDFENLTFFREKMGNKIVQPLAFIEKDNKQYLMTYFLANNLHKVLPLCKEKHKLKYLHHSLDLLFEVQTLGDQLTLDNPTEDQEYYTKRIHNVFFSQIEKYLITSQSTKEDILDSWHHIEPYLRNVKEKYYKDHNLKNIVINPEGGLALVDFESNRNVNYLIDVVNLLEFNNLLSEDQLKQFVEGYRVKNQESLNAEEYFFYYQFASLQRHLELAGYRARDHNSTANESEYQSCVYHLEMAKIRLEQLSQKDSNLQKILHPFKELKISRH